MIINLEVWNGFYATSEQVAINTLFQIKNFQNTTFGYVTDILTVTFYLVIKFFSQEECI